MSDPGPEICQKPNIPSHIRLLLKSKNGSKVFYRTIMNNFCSDAKQSLFWEQTLLVKLSDKTWKLYLVHASIIGEKQ